jgi:P-type E1-E2 ATPase
LLEFDIPGFGVITLKHLVSDFTGTLSFHGKLIPGVKERLNKLSESLTIHVLTSDTFGTAESELKDVGCTVRVLDGEDDALQKKRYVEELGPGTVVAFGNGNNDKQMLETARIGVAVMEREGCAAGSLLTSSICISSVIDGLDLLLNAKRLIATLRY